MRNTWLTTFLLVVSCGSRETIIEPALAPYVYEVLSWCLPASCQLREDIDTIAFGDAGGAAGLCERSAVGRNIYINRAEWQLYSENIRLELIAHELGHCNWNRKDNHHGNLMDGSTYHYDTPARETFMRYFYGTSAPTEQDTPND